MAKTPKGELTGAELRKLIKAHNILVSIKIPKGTDREGLIKLIENKGYKVDHKNKKIVDAKKDRPRRPKVTLEKAKEITKPKPKTALEKQKLAEAKAEKEEKKKKEERVIRKKAVEEEKKRAIDRKKTLKKKSVEKKKEDMPNEKKVETKVKDIFKDFDFFHKFSEKFLQMINKEFDGDLDKVKTNITAKTFDKFIGEGDKAITGFKEYYKGMNVQYLLVLRLRYMVVFLLEYPTQYLGQMTP